MNESPGAASNECGFMTGLRTEISLFDAASAWAAQVVASLPETAWEGPGLGGWNMRALVGHTSRAMLTVEQYLGTPASQESVRSAEAYYERVAELPGADAGAVLQRGIEAGLALGESPDVAFAAIARRVSELLENETDRLISTLAGGMMLSNYLPTRTFELIVHGLDIARAADIEVEPPERCLARVAELGVSLALNSGSGTPLLMALTGRVELPAGFSVLP